MRTERLRFYMSNPHMEKPLITEWKPKHPYIPTLTISEYEAGASDEYWAVWPKNAPENISKSQSWIDPSELVKLAEEANYRDKESLGWVVKQLTEGARLGARGSARLPNGCNKNYSSAYEFGHLMADSLADWCARGLAIGPCKLEELPWPDPKTSPLSIALKPNGSGRVVIDMSAPHLDNVDLSSSIPSSLNSGIDISEFPSSGSSTKDVLKALEREGQGCVFTKIDWTDAYKHLLTHPDDQRLQTIQWSGRYFVELYLTFGCKSSPGIYDRTSDIFLRIVCLLAETKRRLKVKQLDDAVMFGKQSRVEHFYSTYKSSAARVGIRCAAEVGDKCFGVTSRGVVLGIEYDTHLWQWRLPAKKAFKIISSCNEMIETGRASIKDLTALVGRITFYSPVMGESSWWERAMLLSAANQSKNMKHVVKLSGQCISQVNWWIRNVLMAQEYSPIPDFTKWEPSSGVLHLHTDASGGGMEGADSIARGVGGVMEIGSTSYWFYLQHSRIIRTGGKTIWGEVPARKLSFLEGSAILAGIGSLAKIVKNGYIVAHCDNAGVVHGSNKGHSRDLLTYTVIKACHNLSRGINARLVVKKTKRCSTRLDRIADFLSKGCFDSAVSLMQPNRVFVEVPRSIIKFLRSPVHSRQLGMAVLEELSHEMEVLDIDPEPAQDLEQFLFKRKRN